MPQRHEDELPADLAEKLSPAIERALKHPVRRSVLRALDRDGAGRTLSELGTLIPGVPISTISYHVLVLEECGSVSVSVSLAQRRGDQRFASNLGEDAAVRQVLDRTRGRDEGGDG